MKKDMTAEEYLRKILSSEVRDDCPMRKTLELLSGKWRIRIIYELCKRPICRFGELKKAVPRITNTMLTTLNTLLQKKGRRYCLFSLNLQNGATSILKSSKLSERFFSFTANKL